MRYRILLSGGGTAGSVTPLLALASELRQRHPAAEFLFIGSTNGPEKVLVEAASIPFRSIASGKLRRYWSWKNIQDIGKIFRGYQQAKKIIRDWKPNVSISAGSFVSVPVIWASHWLSVQTLVHQQDVRPGLANKLMMRAANVITVAFQQSLQDFPPAKVHWTGNPVRPEIIQGDKQKARDFFHLESNIPVLLVLGGGTGSRSINMSIAAVMKQLTTHWQILHVIGPEREVVEVQHARYQQFSFLTTELPDALAVADIVISRAGLGALTELAALSKPTIFIPMPGSHQEANAQLVANHSAGIVLQETTALPTDITQTLDRLRQSPDEALALGKKLHELYTPNAAAQLANEVIKLMKSS